MVTFFHIFLIIITWRALKNSNEDITKKTWIYNLKYYYFFFVKISFILFLDRGEGREKEGEKHQCVVASHTPPTGGLAHNPGMCPDWESNQRPFGSQAGTPSTESHQPGQNIATS